MMWNTLFPKTAKSEKNADERRKRANEHNQAVKELLERVRSKVSNDKPNLNGTDAG